MCQPLPCTSETQLTFYINMYVHRQLTICINRYVQRVIYCLFNVEDVSAFENIMDIHISSSRETRTMVKLKLRAP